MSTSKSLTFNFFVFLYLPTVTICVYVSQHNIKKALRGNKPKEAVSFANESVFSSSSPTDMRY